MSMQDNNNPERFRNRKEALLWLQSKGQISQGKFYTDCADGVISIYPDKSLSKFQVAEYAEKVFSFVRMGRREIEAENQKRKQDPMWLHHDDVVCIFSVLWDAVQLALGNCSMASAEEITLAAGGDSSKAIEVETLINELVITKAFSSITAIKNFDVLPKNFPPKCAG